MQKEAAKEIIKRHLWTFANKARDVSSIPGTTYDLLVNEDIRMKVMVLEPGGATPTEQEGCDVIALVGGTTRKPKRYYLKNGSTDLFETPKNVLTTETS